MVLGRALITVPPVVLFTPELEQPFAEHTLFLLHDVLLGQQPPFLQHHQVALPLGATQYAQLGRDLPIVVQERDLHAQVHEQHAGLHPPRFLQVVMQRPFNGIH